MTPPRRKPLHGEDGFALIEVLVSALVLAIAAAGVLALLQATTRSAASERQHSEAYALAQEDQARLRSMRLSSLNRLNQSKTVPLDGSVFTIASKGIFINNSTRQPSSCTTEKTSADYVRITSTTSWEEGRHSIVMESIVSPSNGSLDPNHGILVVTIKNSEGGPLAGVTLTGQGAGTFSGTTDSTGCANFADLPAGQYLVSATGAGLIDTSDYSPPKPAEIGVTAGGTASLALQFDNRPASIPVKFKARVGNTNTFTSAKSDSIFVFNNLMELGRTPYWTPIKSREATVTATPVYPFKNPVTVYAGACETNNPNPNGTNPAGAAAMTTYMVSPGLVAPAQTIQIPAFGLEVWTGSSSSSKGSAVTSGTVVATDTKCNFEGKAVKHTFTLSSGVVQEPWLPYGTYEVCADNGSRRQTAKMSVTNLAAATTATLYLSGSGSSSGKC